MNEKLILFALILAYFIPARLIFDYVYQSSQTVIDEVFHLPIGLKYCKTNFSEWDDKITTLPGLYLFSSLITVPFKQCTVYALRYTVFFTSLLNLLVLYFLRREWHPYENKFTRACNVFNIVTIPPVLFFSMVYYTDVLSMTLVNAMILFGLKGHSFLASIFGFLSVITRQNNVVYILFIAGYRVLGHGYHIITKRASADGNIKDWDLRMFKIKLREFIKSNVWRRDYTALIIEGLCYSAPLMTLALFVHLNGSVVVGDKTAHKATIHLPQLFYFSIFAMFFVWPYATYFILPFYKFVYRHFVLSLLLLVAIFYIISFNTIVHPYLLADNRHYLFYVWKHFMDTPMQRRVLCPIYLGALYCLARLCYRPSDPRFAVVYPVMLAIILCTQSLIDVRYYLTPYVILRTFIGPTNRIDLTLEFMFQTTVSAYTLLIFGRKEIYWTDFDDVQRLIW